MDVDTGQWTALCSWVGRVSARTEETASVLGELTRALAAAGGPELARQNLQVVDGDRPAGSAVRARRGRHCLHVIEGGGQPW